MNERLQKAVLQATIRFADAADRGLFARLTDKATPETVVEWLRGVEHIVSQTYTGKRKRYVNGSALVEDRTVLYNPRFLEVAEDFELLDVVLHEIGHLFVWDFVRDARGKRCAHHGSEWRLLGWIVGYAPQGSKSREGRRRLIRDVEYHRTNQTEAWKRAVMPLSLLYALRRAS